MSNLIEQFEQAAQNAVNPFATKRSSRPELSSSGFITVPIVDDVPMFKKQKTSIKPISAVTHMIASNNQLVIAMKNKVLLRVDLQHVEKIDEVDVNEKTIGTKIHKLFMDPTGQHLLISLAAADVDSSISAIYLSRNSKKYKICNRMKSSPGVITAIAWNSLNAKENSSGGILIGTNKGHIYETELVMGEEWNLFQSSPEQYWKQIFSIGGESTMTITSIEYQKFPDSDTKYFVLVTTPSRLYQFIGEIIVSVDCELVHIFNNYMNVPERFMEIPGDLSYSQLEFYCKTPQRVPTVFAWMTGAGIFHGLIDCSGLAGHDSVIKDSQLLPHPVDKGEISTPLAIVLLEFHVMILFQDRLKAICLLNEQVVFEDIFMEMYGRMLGLVKDPIKGTVWAFAEQAVFEYKIVNEARNVWEVYLEKGKYDLARQYCENHPAKMDKVLMRQAEDLFNKKNFMESANLYASTLASFEDVTLKFLNMEEYEALKTYLTMKMLGLKPQDKTQITMIVIWLVELYLNDLGKFHDAKREKTADGCKLRDEFYKLLDTPKVKDSITNNKSTIYQLMASHGDQESLIYFANRMKDYERVIQHHMHNGSFREALKVLQKEGSVDLFYHYSPALMQAIPQETVDIWMQQGRKLNPTFLIPALLQCDQFKDRLQDNQAVRYLEFCVNKLNNKEQSIHNYLISLYVRLKPDKLMDYLNLQGQDADSVSYDLKYALRICSEFALTRACVLIYTTMGLYEEAVDLALQEDVELAKQNADRPEDNTELRKKLWLKIARHVVEKEDNIKKAMEFLHECELIKIEDIIPFFPNFVTIENFKDAICTSLQEYNQHIEVLQEEMNDATNSAQEIRSEIQAFRNRHAFIKTDDKCSICSFSILTRAFYVFPCHHMFHSDCLVAEVRPNLTAGKRFRVVEIQRQLATHGTIRESLQGGQTPAMAAAAARDHLKAELDDLIASECLHCGEIMITSIDVPFIEADEKDELQTWE